MGVKSCKLFNVKIVKILWFTKSSVLRPRYQNEFEVVNLGDETLLNETVIIDSFNSHLPLERFVPIAKHALNGNLKHLRDHIELT